MAITPVDLSVTNIAPTSVRLNWVRGNWTPLQLFLAGALGFWFDPSDLSTLFQDAAGTIPVTADGDPVGLMLDKSGNEYHASQSVSGRRAVYRTDGALHWLESDGIDDNMPIPGSSSAFKFMHDGTGGSVSAAVMSLTDDSFTQFISSQQGSSVNVGFALLRANRSIVGSERDSAGFEVLRGVSSTNNISIRVDNKIFVNIPYIMRANYKNNGLTDDGILLLDSSLIGNSPTALSPSSGDSTIDVALFGNIFINSSARIYGAVLREGAILGTDGQNVDEYLDAKSGVTL